MNHWIKRIVWLVVACLALVFLIMPGAIGLYIVSYPDVLLVPGQSAWSLQSVQKAVDYFGLAKKIELGHESKLENAQSGVLSSAWRWSGSVKANAFGKEVVLRGAAKADALHGPFLMGEFAGDLFQLSIQDISMDLQSSDKALSDVISKGQVNEQIAKSIAGISNMRVGVNAFGRVRMLFDRKIQYADNFFIEQRCEYIMQKAKASEATPADILKAFIDPRSASTRCSLLPNGQEHWKYAGDAQAGMPAIALGSIRSESDGVFGKSLLPFYSTGGVTLGQSTFGGIKIPLPDDRTNDKSKASMLSYITPEVIVDQSALTAEVSALQAPRLVYRFETAVKTKDDGRLESSDGVKEGLQHSLLSIVTALNTMTEKTLSLRIETGLELSDDASKWHAVGDMVRESIAEYLSNKHKVNTSSSDEADTKKLQEQQQKETQIYMKRALVAYDVFGSWFLNLDWSTGKGGLSLHQGITRNPAYTVNHSALASIWSDGFVKSLDFKIDKSVVDAYLTFLATLEDIFQNDAQMLTLLKETRSHTSRTISFLKKENILVERDGALNVSASSVGFDVTINGKKMRVDKWMVVFAKYLTYMV